MSAVLTTLRDGVLTLTLNRPEKRNAIDRAMLDGLAEGLAQAELDATVRLVVLRGAGTDFCAGADLSELLESAQLPLEENERHALALGEIFLALRRMPKLSVAVVHGRALAGGAGLAMACNLVLTSDDARLGYPEIARGFVPAMVMTMLRRAVGEKRAFELVATGRVVGADEALALGLVSRVLPAAEFEATVADAVNALRQASPTALALTKQLFVDLDDCGFREGILLGARVNALSRSTADFRERIAAFVAAR